MLLQVFAEFAAITDFSSADTFQHGSLKGIHFLLGYLSCGLAPEVGKTHGKWVGNDLGIAQFVIHDLLEVVKQCFRTWTRGTNIEGLARQIPAFAVGAAQQYHREDEMQLGVALVLVQNPEAVELVGVHWRRYGLESIYHLIKLFACRLFFLAEGNHPGNIFMGPADPIDDSNGGPATGIAFQHFGNKVTDCAGMVARTQQIAHRRFAV